MLGVLLVAGAALGFGVWSAGLGEREAVVVAAREIPAGATVEAADLGITRVAVEDGVAVIAAAGLRSLVGQVAAATIPAGGLLHPSQVTEGSLLAPGEAVVGVSLTPGAVPIPDLGVGDRVAVVGVADPARPTSDGDTSVIASAEVFAVQALDDASRNVVVSLRLAAGDATVVADAAAANRVRLVLVAEVAP